MKYIFKNKIYSLLYSVLFLPLALIRVIYKSYKNPDYLIRLAERFAIYGPECNLYEHYDLWIHTVSVGEFLAAKTLIDNIINSNPNIQILITTTTPTGSSLVVDYIEKNKGNKLSHVYYPYDVKFICNKFINKLNPSMAVFFETELWPRMYSVLSSRRIKLFLLNARISEKSFNGYIKIKSYISTVINNIDFIAAQSNYDKLRLEKLGYINKLEVYGNIKYNFKIPEDLDSQSKTYKNIIGYNNKIFIGASTHMGEEDILIDTYVKLKKEHDNLKLVLAPRHPERFDEVYRLCMSKNLKVTKYSEICNINSPNYEGADIFLLDTIGKLLYFYNISDIAFIGGSLVDVGGHNPIEPAMLKIPTIIGPRYHNFRQIVDDLAVNQGIIKLKSNNELEAIITSLLNNEQVRLKLINSAYNFVQKQQMVMKKYLDLINNCLK